MLVKKAIRTIMDRKGIGLNALARMMGKNSQFVSDKLNPAKGLNMSTDKLDEMIRAMGYKIVLMPADVCVRDGWYEIDDSRVAGDGDNASVSYETELVAPEQEPDVDMHTIISTLEDVYPTADVCGMTIESLPEDLPGTPTPGAGEN